MVTRRYPFSASSNDAPFDDFARLFAPGGLLDTFFQTQIKPFVDTSGAVWRLQPLGGVAPPVSRPPWPSSSAPPPSGMRSSRTAATPQLRFDVTPQSPGDGEAGDADPGRHDRRHPEARRRQPR